MHAAFALALAHALAAGPVEPEVRVEVIDAPPRAAALCDALTPPGRAPGRLDVVARARAEAERAARREQALQGRYQVTIPAARLPFAPYDPGDATLALSGRAFLGAAGGSLWLWTLHDEGLPVQAAPPAAARVMAAAARGTLELSLTFTLPEDDDEDVSCAGVAGARRWGLGVEPYAWAWIDRDRVLARGGAGSDRPLVTVAEGARPAVRLGPWIGDDRALAAPVEARRGELEACYREALRRDGGLDGGYVAELDLAAQGPGRVRMALDAVQDEALARCVTGVLARVAPPPGAPARAMVQVQFELVPPDEVAAAGR